MYTCIWAPKVFVMANTRLFRVAPIDHEKVKEFLDIAPEKAVILSGWPPTVMLDRWVARERVIIDSDAEESDDINMTDKYNGGVYEHAEWYIACVWCAFGHQRCL